MSEEKQIYNITAENGVKELIIRHGDAAKPERERKQIIIGGTIKTPADYMVRRVHLFNKDKAYLLINRTQNVAKFFENPDDELGTIVTGKLEINPELQALNINAEKMYGQKELLSLLRKNKRFFSDFEKHAELLDRLSNLTFEQNIKGESANDRKGNAKAMIAKKTDTNLSLDFRLSMPIYKGSENSLFAVEILLDITDSATRFWLESIDLYDLAATIRDKEMDYLLDQFTDQQILVIEV